jgi:hypothetical protein
MGNGLRFRKADLHVHTPASACFIEQGVGPEDIVERALAEGLVAIAVTDHNTGAWVDRIKEAARGRGLTVFPGVEITVAPGVHVVALLPTDRTTAHVDHLLSLLGIAPDRRGDSTALVTRYGVQEVVTVIHENGALPVLAHVDAVKGAWTELQGQTRVQLWQRAPFAAVELAGDTLPPEVGHPPYDRRPAYYWASDNPHPRQRTKHSHRGIGERYTCFKLDTPITWEGLRLCFDDPGTRIRRALPTLAHPVIERVQVHGGFLGGLDVELSPYLNCLIGGRGTGKSALLELLRHLLGAPVKTTENAQQAHSLVDHTFPSGARATVEVRVGDVRYRVTRTVGREPEVERADDGRPVDVAPDDLFPLQVYGQKEIYQISLDPEFQLRLLDNYVAEDLKALQEAEAELLRDLRTNAEEILRREEAVRDGQQFLRELAAVQEELRRLEALNFGERVRRKEHYDREQRLLDAAQAQVDALLTALRAFPGEQRLAGEVLADEVLEDLPNRDVLRAQRALLEAINAHLDRELAALAASVEGTWAKGEEARARWRRAYAEQERAYRQVLAELAEAGQVDPDRYIQLQERRAELEARAQQVARDEEAIDAALAQRRRWLEALRSLRRRRYEMRCQKAAALTEALDAQVRITIHPAGHREVYQNYLRALFAGLNVRDPKRSELAEVRAARPEREAQRPVEVDGEVRHLVPEIPRYLDPIDLAAAIDVEQRREDDAPSALEARFGVDSATMRRNMAGLGREKLFELELFEVPDRPVIELRVGRGLLGYRALEHLSVGQRCTALLSIILLESDAPLLIDQPEDDLDNQFIFDQIVTTLRGEKERRQFLIATHNANIPVSGDAELIVVLEADESHGRVMDDGLGSIDKRAIKRYVTQILEGGSRAFRIRKEKYGRMVEE